MQRRTLITLLASLTGGAVLPTWAQVGSKDEAPDALIKRLSTDLLELVKKDPALKKGDLARISEVVDREVIPYVNFRKMTSAAVGPQWRQASEAQREQLQQAFKGMLIRTYAGALAQVSDQKVVVKPLRAAPGDTDVLVRTEVRGKGEPIKLDYRLDKAAAADTAWKIIDVNVGGLWLVQNYRSQFAQELTKGGIDGLITTLVERNKTAAK